ncbi:biotin carboxylase N-terminal domain-containing protein [Thalassospiraceae bacterium LMO-JJ14]|nr:biotin carboxylase N-terminal domain-containing protein [Thalassospiraceae bacterium LMO-JJ14]
MKKILVANRGEIACRIFETCKKMGLQTVAVYSEADANALHVQRADEAVLIGPSPAQQSYLNVDAILAAVESTNADAVHPGYGFLSENTAFAKRIMDVGKNWIGPSPETIKLMGDKERARNIAAAADVPVLPASEPFDENNVAAIVQAAEDIGYPLLVKAAGGGGGIGMRRVDAPEKLEAALLATQNQAARSFGDGKVYLEKFIEKARHVEVQVFGLGDGRATTFSTRDCSVQRRFQKIIEEAPAPFLPAEMVEAICAAALSLAQTQKYASAGTVEFVVDTETDTFFFLEMNTRLQVEHGVSELVLGIDIVEKQLRLAAGETSDELLEARALQGHAIEVRVCAEKPEKGFLPQPGSLDTLVWPSDMEGIRIDTGVQQGDSVTPFYDPMIAKIMSTGADRTQAADRLVRALRDVRIEGVSTNLAFLINALEHPDFREGNITTAFVEHHLSDLIGT